MASAYKERIRETVASLGLIGRYEPADVEAWMRLEHPTLDGLSKGQFRKEVAVAIQCIDAAGAEETKQVRESYGL